MQLNTIDGRGEMYSDKPNVLRYVDRSKEIGDIVNGKYINAASYEQEVQQIIRNQRSLPSVTAESIEKITLQAAILGKLLYGDQYTANQIRRIPCLIDKFTGHFILFGDLNDTHTENAIPAHADIDPRTLKILEISAMEKNRRSGTQDGTLERYRLLQRKTADTDKNPFGAFASLALRYSAFSWNKLKETSGSYPVRENI